MMGRMRLTPREFRQVKSRMSTGTKQSTNETTAKHRADDPVRSSAIYLDVAEGRPAAYLSIHCLIFCITALIFCVDGTCDLQDVQARGQRGEVATVRGMRRFIPHLLFIATVAFGSKGRLAVSHLCFRGISLLFWSFCISYNRNQLYLTGSG